MVRVVFNRVFLGLAGAGLLVAAPAMAADPGAAKAGEALFHGRCAMCHQVTPGGAAGPMAPNLRGLVGRAAASTGFKNYSPALKRSKLTWSAANLDQFLAAPGKLVPGTRMVVSLPDAKQRVGVIAYLASLH